MVSLHVKNTKPYEIYLPPTKKAPARADASQCVCFRNSVLESHRDKDSGPVERNAFDFQILQRGACLPEGVELHQ